MGNCRCCAKFDGHPFLVYHASRGTLICYQALVSYVHSFVNSGTSVHAQWQTITNNYKQNKQNSTLSYQSWLRAFDGFIANLKFNNAEAFSCPHCGIDPLFYVGDVKCTGKCILCKFFGMWTSIKIPLMLGPFSSMTTLNFDCPKALNVKIEVYCKFDRNLFGL